MRGRPSRLVGRGTDSHHHLGLAECAGNSPCGAFCHGNNVGRRQRCRILALARRTRVWELPLLAVATPILVAITTFVMPAAAQRSTIFAERMTFTPVQPREPVALFGNAWTILAMGAVDPGAPARLRATIEAHRVPERSIVHFNSPGGDVTAAMELGRVIRETGLYTHLGDPGTVARPEPREPSICLSACALAFIGGQFRWATSDRSALFGVHRFYGPDRALGDDLSQVLSNRIIQYIREMGVDVALFSEVVRAGRDGINLLDRRRLEALGVVNNGVGPTSWTIESASGALYLRGERETHRGVNKFMLVCEGRRFLLWIIFDAEGAWDQVRLMNSHSLLIDGLPHALALRPGVSEIRLANGWVNVIHPIDGPMIDLVARARTVGFAAQFAPAAPTFRGFDGMEIAAARERLHGLRRACGA
jgi:hypothetical protein